MVDFQNIMGGKTEGDAVDLYGWGTTTPYLSKTKKEQADKNESDGQESENSARNSQNIKILEDIELIGECHIGF